VVQGPVVVNDVGGSRSRVGSVVDWAFRSRQTGRVTIAQFPNAALWIFLVTVVVRWVVPVRGSIRTGVDVVALVSLGAWALDEVIRGVNPWRRLLGLGGCGFVVAGIVSIAR
jgi:hypothetical protein